MAKKKAKDVSDLFSEPKTESQIKMENAQDLYNFLFEACNILRGPVSQDNFKDYIRDCRLMFSFERSSDWSHPFSALGSSIFRLCISYRLFQPGFSSFPIHQDIAISSVKHFSVSLSDIPTYNRLIAKNLRNNGETCR